MRNCDNITWVVQIEHFAHLFRYSKANHGLAITAILTAGMSMGTVIATFIVFNLLLLRPLPYVESERLVRITRVEPGSGWNVTPDIYDYWRNHNRVFDDMATYRCGEMNWTDVMSSDVLRTCYTTPSFFRVLGLAPLMGRTYSPSDDTAVLSYGLWKSRFSGSSDIIGKPIVLDGHPFTVIGVMTPRYVDPRNRYGWDDRSPDLWIFARGWLPAFARNDRPDYYVLGRLRWGVSLAEAQANMSVVTRRLGADNPREYGQMDVKLQTVQADLAEEVKPRLALMLLSTGIVLLIACINVTNLMLAGVSKRADEFAIRISLGASRMRIARQVIGECVIISLTAGALALFASTWARSLMSTVLPFELPAGPDIDIRVVVFALSLSVLAGVAFGIAPAVASSHTGTEGIAGSARLSSTPRRRKAAAIIVATQVMFAVILLANAGLMIRSVWLLGGVDPGFRPDRLVALQFNLSERYKKSLQIATFYDSVLSRIKELPGVESAAVTRALPTMFISSTGIYADSAKLNGAVGASWNLVSGDYFRTAGIPIIQGRTFSREDAFDPRAVIINESMARQLWPTGGAIGRRIKMSRSSKDWLNIVGVAGDLKDQGLDKNPYPAIYQPVIVAPYRKMYVLVRTKTDIGELTPALKAQAAFVDRTQPVADVIRLTDELHNMTAGRRRTATVLGVLAIIALVTAALGVYAVTYYSLAQRRHEFGIRIALGGGGRDIIALVAREAFTVIASASGAGIVGGIAASRLIKNQFYGVAASDPATLTGTCLVLGVTMLVACLLPAYKATKANPVDMLRTM